MQSQSKIVLSKHTCCALSCRVAQYMESHPARVRESKSCTDGLPQGAQSVAPHAGARIKIVGLTHSFIRAIVAPCAGARIEMFGLSCQKRRWPRRTPRGCVNRNQGVGGCTGCALCGRVNRNAPRVAEPTMTCCRTSRGCANRNGKKT